MRLSGIQVSFLLHASLITFAVICGKTHEKIAPKKRTKINAAIVSEPPRPQVVVAKPSNPKKVTAPASAKKTTPPTKKTPVKKQPVSSERKKQQQLLNQLAKSLDRISEPQKKSAAQKQLSVPSKIKGLSVDLKAEVAPGQKKGERLEFRSELALRLQESLNLPDFGHVKVKLTLSPGGSVEKVEIIEAESLENREYLEMALRNFHFNHKNLANASKEQRTLVVRFCNEL